MNKSLLCTLLTGLTVNIWAQNKNSGINTAHMDKSADPKSNFYQYACGNWLTQTQIPSSESSYGSFNEIKDRNEINLRKILEEIAADKNAAQGSNRQKIRDLYLSAMDTLKIEKQGLQPLSEDLNAIDKLSSLNELYKLLSTFHKKGVGAVFSFSVFADLKSSNENMCYLNQGGINLPDRDFYFDARYEGIKKAYMQHVENMFKLLGQNAEQAKSAMEVVLKIETALASESMNMVQLRDIEAQYNKFTTAEVKQKYANLNWDSYLNDLGLKNLPQSIVVCQPKFYSALNELIVKTPLKDWKTYLKWSLIHSAAPYLDQKTVKENFSFYGTVLSGTKVMRPRWKKSLQIVDGALGEALGQIFVDKYFNDEAKKKVNALVDNLIAAYKERINSRDWMSQETKVAALQKLDKIYRKLGFPDKWKDYSALEVKTDSYLSNIYRSNLFDFKDMLDQLGKPVDKTKWGMTPPTVNAYYNPTTNEITFPAGIMQPPFFNAQADDAANYGCMGAIIGHELTHGFDDEGCKFDSEGNMKDWWMEADKKKFEEKTKLLVNQFDNYVAIDSTHVNGQLTLGENIADLGGLTISYYAYKMSLNGKKSEVIDGFTGEQRFFIAWAQGWKTLMRPQALKQLIATNPHSPGNFRAIGPLSNMPEFYEAFSIQPGDAMYRKEGVRVNIW